MDYHPSPSPCSLAINPRCPCCIWDEVHSFYLFFGHTVWHTELSLAGIKPATPTVETESLKHWTARKVHGVHFYSEVSIPLSQ